MHHIIPYNRESSVHLTNTYVHLRQVGELDYTNTYIQQIRRTNDIVHRENTYIHTNNSVYLEDIKYDSDIVSRRNHLMNGLPQ